MKMIEKLEKQETETKQKKILKNLNEKLKELDKINNMNQLRKWHLALVTFVSSFLDTESKQYNNILKNSIFSGRFIFSDEFDEEKNNASIILQSLIDSIGINGLPQNNTIQSDKSINFNNNTTVNQNQTVQIEIMQTIKEELGNAKMRELEELVKKEPDKDSKLKKMALALKDFGIETVSSTLAKVILSYLGK